VFNIQFRGAWLPALILYLAITGLTIVLGWLNGRKIINQPPMEILRGN
jgi:putative ABC transport system permease protein